VTKWSKDLVLYRMARAEETLEDARILAHAGRWNACVNRLYYSCFYAVSALLVRHGLSSSKHTGVRSLFNRHYVKTDKIPKSLARIYNDLFERRQEGDYGDQEPRRLQSAFTCKRVARNTKQESIQGIRCGQRKANALESDFWQS
jgi:uncharacterized protein (UPF0332 family)